MSVVNINFTRTYTPPASNAVNLRFGVSDVVPVDPLSAVVIMSKPAPSLQFNSAYFSNVSRPVAAGPHFAWEAAAIENKHTAGGWGLAGTMREQTAEFWQTAEPLHTSTSDRTEQLDRNKVESSIPWQQAAKVDQLPISDNYKVLAPDRVSRYVPWQRAVGLQSAAMAPFVQLWPFKRLLKLSWLDALHLTRIAAQPFNRARDGSRHAVIPWQDGRKPSSGRESNVIVPPVQPPYDPDYDLNFRCKCTFPDPLNVLLNFGLDPCPVSIEVPARKVYFIVNSISLKRVSDNQPIGINSATVGIDSNSWCWSFSATIPYNQLDRVEPTALGPVEVELEINGVIWRFLVEEYDEKKQFGKTNISIKGRSVTAYLESPYAPVRSFTQSTSLTSRQFAEAELTRAGLVTGFTLDWQLIDALGWQMPANTWSYNDLTPIQVIQAIAQGAGGFVNSHPSNKELIVLPEYPAAAWEWASAAVAKSIPKTLIRNQNLRWAEKPLYNGVYVSGENTGVTALVKRAGTDGAFQAPMYVSPMISASAAARNKGTAILSAGGKQAQVGLELPMEAALGLVTPGMLIEVTNGGYGIEPAWRGLVRSTAISASWSEGLTVSQSIDLERHYGGL